MLFDMKLRVRRTIFLEIFMVKYYYKGDALWSKIKLI